MTRSAPCAKSPGFPGSCISRSGPRWRFESPLFSHPSTSPALDPQVTPRSRSSLQRLPMHLRVTPHFASSGSAGVRSSGRPESRLHSALPAVFKFRVSPQLYFAPAPLDASRVSPVFASSGPAGDRSSSCPDSRILQRLCCVGCEFPRCFALPAAPPNTGSRYAPVPVSSGYTGNGYSSYPEPLVLRCSRCLSSRFPSRSAPPGCSSRRRFEFPHALRLPAWPRV